MLKALTIFALTNAASTDTTLSTVALGIAILALLVSMVALSRARRAGDADRTDASEALAATSVGSAAAGTLAPEDDRQLVAVLTAAVAAVMADEQGADAPAPKITGIRQVGAAAPAAAAPAAPAGNGPYAGFTVRRIRRV